MHRDVGHPEMPRWLAQVVAALVDGQDADAVEDWMRQVRCELERLGGQVPFRVVHDWHARTVAPMLAEASARDGGNPQLQQAVQRLHARALAGEPITEIEWVAALRPALHEVYHYAYAYVDAYAVAHANAVAYATANDFSADEAADFAETYATINTDANARSYADANAIANADASAAAFATADPHAYAEAYPCACVHAYAHAHANQDELPGRAERHGAAYRRLADGLTESLGRVGR